MEDKIVEILKQNNGHLTRRELWQLLCLPNDSPTDQYWSAEQELVDRKTIERRRGRNGGIYLIEVSAGAPQESEEAAAQLLAQEKREEAHYERVLETIRAKWTEQPGFKAAFGAITALQGKRRTGGRWSRPDLIVCTVSEWIFSSRPDGDVRTFEIKRFEALDVLAVYEALSHKSRAHYSYVLVTEFPEKLDEVEKEDFENVLAVAARHGIGVITANDSSDWNTWEFELDARRSDADSQAINQTLLDQVPSDVRDAFHHALRTVTVRI